MIAAGQSIGNYRILNKIGTGGMGAVYLAEHPLIGKRVALKVIHRELAGNREVVQRFFQEAKAVNKIGNEHIVEIHDFGVTPEGDHFYIMEYLEGQNLASVLQTETLFDIMRALHIGAQIASALSAAHASGVIHRDLKPDNVMLTLRLGDPDFVKLLDFGLAKMFAMDGSSPVKTAAGVLLGTPQYMSPEACESRTTIDFRTDIYALGILLFQMMTGVLPFDGESMGEVLVKQVTQLPPPPRGFNPQIPPSVEQILLRCLLKRPEARFASMNALREALLDPESYLRKSPPVSPARSLAPGEANFDAKTVQAYVAAERNDRAKTRIGIAGGAGLQQPPPMPAGFDGAPIAKRTTTQGPDMSLPAQLKTNTMRIDTPLGYSSRPPRKMWPVVLVIALLLGLGGGAFAVAWFGRKDGGLVARSGSGSGSSATTTGSGSATNGSVATGSAGLAGSATAGSAAAGSGSKIASAGSGAGSGSDTKHVGSAGSAAVAAGSNAGSGSDTKHVGVGSGSALTHVAAGSGSAGAGSAVAAGSAGPIAAAGSGAHPGSGSGSGSGAGSAAHVGAGSGSAHVGTGAGSNEPTVPTTAVVVIDSMPQGAEVFGPDKKSIGKTPATLTLPISKSPIVYELRLAGYRRRIKQVVVAGDIVVNIPLDRVQVVRVNHRGSGAATGGSGGSSDDLEVP